MFVYLKIAIILILLNDIFLYFFCSVHSVVEAYTKYLLPLFLKIYISRPIVLRDGTIFFLFWWICKHINLLQYMSIFIGQYTCTWNFLSFSSELFSDPWSNDLIFIKVDLLFRSEVDWYNEDESFDLCWSQYVTILDPDQLFKVGDAVKVGENAWRAPIQVNNPIDREVLQARYQFMIEVCFSKQVQYLFLAWNTKLLFDDNLFGRQNFCLITIFLEDIIFVGSQFIWKIKFLFYHNLFGRQNCCLFTIYLEDKIVVCSQFVWKTKLLSVHNLFGRQNCCLFTICLEDRIVVCSQFIWKTKLLSVHNLFGRQNCCLFTIYLEDKITVCSQFIWKTKLLFDHNLFGR
jgi:hypothetical protein